jgi:hypothetical protein
MCLLVCFVPNFPLFQSGCHEPGRPDGRIWIRGFRDLRTALFDGIDKNYTTLSKFKKLIPVKEPFNILMVAAIKRTNYCRVTY